MSRISIPAYETLSAEAQEAFDEHLAFAGRMTNMKKTLLHSVPAFKAYMQWYDLWAELQTFISYRSAVIFAHAISSQNGCLICSTFFRCFLIDEGENPDVLALSEQDQVLVDYGQQLVIDDTAVSPELFKRLQAAFTEKQVVVITAFAGLMIATNLINNALNVPLDEYLYEYSKKETV